MDNLYEDDAECVTGGSLVRGVVGTSISNCVTWDRKRGVVLNAVMTSDEWRQLGICLDVAHIKSNTILRFARGDWYNHLASEKRGDKKRAVLDALGSDTSLQMAKTCGWVAGSWPIDYRRLDGDWSACWSFYRETAPYSLEVKTEALDLWLKGGMTLLMLQEYLGGTDTKPDSDALADTKYCMKLVRLALKDFGTEVVAKMMQDLLNRPTLAVQTT